jgi:uncharacterized membrane protein
MSYRIEITAATLTELGGKLLALASQFQTTSADPVMPEVREGAPPKAKREPKAKIVEEVAETAFPPFAPEVAVAPGEPHTSETSAPTPDTSSSSASEPTEQPSPSALDFDKDITPLVLRVVQEKSRETVIEILNEFGAARASEVPEAQWPELLNALQDAL